MVNLKPDKFTYTLILSSPANFPGEITTSENFFLTHALPDFSSGDYDMDPKSRYSRNFFALTFRERELSPEEEKESNPPHYAFVGDYFSVFLSLYFGKRFDNLGFHLDNGLYRLPNLQPARPRKSSQALPFSQSARKDLAIPLELDKAPLLVPILDSIFGDVHRDISRNGSLSDDLIRAFTAGRFYQQALQAYDSDPEFAFLNLVNAGEVLVSGLKFEESELKDECLTAVLAEIDAKLEPTAAKQIRKKFFGQISRRFRKGLAKLLNPAFFSGSESTRDFLCLKPENIEKHLKAAYDLRSRFLHVGTRFGGFITASPDHEEISLAPAAYGDTEWKKLTAIVPTLAGLERVIRFCLLRFVHQRASAVHPSLD
jgi:hypothetical protein